MWEARPSNTTSYHSLMWEAIKTPSPYELSQPEWTLSSWTIIQNQTVWYFNGMYMQTIWSHASYYQHFQFAEASFSASAVSCSWGICIYSRYATVSQQPIVFIRESWMPWATTVVAAPILKLWPEYFLQLIPTLCSTTCRLDTCLWHVKGRLSSNQNSGPGLGPLSCFCSNCAKWLPVTWCMHPSNQCSPNPSTPFGTQYSSPLLPYIHSDYLVNLHS